MSEEKVLTRREFTVASALAMLSGVVITVSSSACGGSASSPSSPTPTPIPPASGGAGSDTVGSISDNHGHVAVITAAELTAGGALSLDIRGTATHTHTVQLSAAELTAVAGNQRVSKSSSTDTGHDHAVTFN